MLKSKLLFSIAIPLIILPVSCKLQQANSVFKKKTNSYPNQITFNAAGQNPEGIAFDYSKNNFYLSAINKEPKIVAVSLDGIATVFSNTSTGSSMSSFGLEVDLKNNRLLACENDKLSGNLAIYNLISGNLQHSIALTPLLTNKKGHQVNDVAVSLSNDIYVTGRLEDVIYKVNSNLQPTIFFEKEGFSKPNGIVAHPDGYLLVSYSNAHSQLVKIPLSNPEEATIIELKAFDFEGFDGMLLNDKNNIVGVSFAADQNNDHYVRELISTDNWISATVVHSKKTNKSTTIAQVAPNTYYAINQDWSNKKAENWTLEKVTF